MKKFIYSLKLVIISSAMLLAASGCMFWKSEEAPPPQVTQVSTIDALLAGIYDGVTTLAELKEYGNFGIGTFNALDGEMVLLDGKFYQIKADGKVYRPALGESTPFAAVVKFDKTKYVPLPANCTYKQLKKILDKEFPNKNLMYAIRIYGEFSKVKTRSVPAQKKPYPPLVQVTKNQPVFNLAKQSGDIVGFRLPPFVKGVNVPGYHLHFLNEKLNAGGHVLDFTLKKGPAFVAVYSRFYLILPDSKGFADADLTRDRAHELEKAEK